jgi:hypothetical protein
VKRVTASTAQVAWSVLAVPVRSASARLPGLNCVTLVNIFLDAQTQIQVPASPAKTHMERVAPPAVLAHAPYATAQRAVPIRVEAISTSMAAQP